MRKSNKFLTLVMVPVLYISYLFLVPACSDEAVVDPVLNTIQVTDADISTTAAMLKGEIEVLGNRDINEYGIELSKSALFSSPVRVTAALPAAAGIFVTSFTALDPNTTYYYRAYVLINTAHVYADNPLHFTTKN